MDAMSEDVSPSDRRDRNFGYEHLPDEQIELILEYLDHEDAKTGYPVRSLLIETGLRVDTLTSIDVADFVSASSRGHSCSDTSEDNEDEVTEDSEIEDEENETD